jgi:hypothetical protein
MPEARHLDTTYQAARSRFIGAAGRAGAELSSFPHPLAGLEGEELAIDVAQLGDPQAPNVLLLISATHGVEGYAGSALQSWWLDERSARLGAGTRVVIVHGFNPVGFSWVRRVNEDNVDLNRNFVDWTEPPANDPYREIADLLVPLSWTEETRPPRRCLKSPGRSVSNSSNRSSAAGSTTTRQESSTAVRGPCGRIAGWWSTLPTSWPRALALA